MQDDGVRKPLRIDDGHREVGPESHLDSGVKLSDQPRRIGQAKHHAREGHGREGRPQRDGQAHLPREQPHAKAVEAPVRQRQRQEASQIASIGKDPEARDHRTDLVGHVRGAPGRQPAQQRQLEEEGNGRFGSGQRQRQECRQTEKGSQRQPGSQAQFG